MIMSKAEDLFALNLQTLRKLKRTTQHQTAIVFGVALCTYRSWEYGKFTPKVSKLNMICRFYNVTVQSMLTESIKEVQNG